MVGAKTTGAHVHPSPVEKEVVYRREIELVIGEWRKEILVVKEEFSESIFALLMEFSILFDLIKDVIIHVLQFTN